MTTSGGNFNDSVTGGDEFIREPETTGGRVDLDSLTNGTGPVKVDFNPKLGFNHFVIISKMGRLSFIAHEGDDKVKAMEVYWELVRAGRDARLYETREVVMV
jgi:hypothetical protein